MNLLLPLLLLAMAPDAQNGFDAARLRRISSRMQEYVDRGVLSGVVFRIERHGKLVYEDAVGLANLETKSPMRANTLFQVMSMTKPVTAIAVMQCVEDGLVLLDAPASRYLPGLKGPTVRQLLTHTGGLSGDDPAGLDDDAKRKLTLAEYTDLLQKEPIAGKPGEAIRYSGPGFAALGGIVETVSRQPLERFMETRIFRPLAMKDTFFFAPTSTYLRIASMVDRKDGKLVPVEPDPYRRGARLANPAGGLYSTARDMAAVLSRLDRILSPASIEAMTTVQTGSLKMDGSDAQGYGLGFAVVKGPEGQGTLKPVGTFGHTGAYGTEFWADRRRGIVAVYMAQSWESEPRRVFNTLANAAFVGP